ncbi:MAG TPA: phosphoribosyltransferase family protein [Candidatus Nanopelagicaceae bacterium]|nr:phosphoribosyltransferase family protein [Candidatus Nanopelagicaceae bacterium]
MKFVPYESRFKAGEILAEFILSQNPIIKKIISNNIERVFSFAIPNGGVPVAEGFCNVLNINYDVLIVRKIKIPYNTEAGFGSVTTDGTVLTNEALLSRLNLSESSIENSIETTKREIRERIDFYNKSTDIESSYNSFINNNYIFIMDDGLASGFTMLAAIKMIKKYNPKQLYIGVPTAPLHTVTCIQHEVDEIYCPNIRKTSWFAVADAYKHWYDVPESEVLDIIKKSKFYFRD